VRGLAALGGRLLPLLFSTRIFGSLATSAQEQQPKWWLLGLLWLMSLLQRELEAELLGEREVKA
jgi:hypothetical protein